MVAPVAPRMTNAIPVSEGKAGHHVAAINSASPRPMTVGAQSRCGNSWNLLAMIPV
jgi:hypothetical protein